MEIHGCIDWISSTSHGKLKNNFRYAHPTLYDAEKWAETKNILGYDTCLKHDNGSFHCSSQKRRDMGTHIIHSGGALARMVAGGGFDSFDILGFYKRNGSNISRVDLCIDVFDSGLDIETLSMMLKSKVVKTNAKSGLFIQSTSDEGDTLYVGSLKKRKKLLRIYDKAKKSKLSGDWIRIEFEIHGKPATKASKLVVESRDKIETMKSIILSYADFHECAIWSHIMNDSDAISIRVKNEVIADTKTWLLSSVAKTLATRMQTDVLLWDAFQEAVTRELRVIERRR